MITLFTTVHILGASGSEYEIGRVDYKFKLC